MHNVQITRTQLDKVMESLEDFAAGSPNPDVDFQSNYVGRGMYGGPGCVAVVSNDASVPAAFLFLVAEILERDFLELLGDLGGGESDSWGMSTVTYWRGLGVGDDE